MKAHIKDGELANFVYPDISEEAQEVGNRLNLDVQQLNLYNFLSRQDFFLCDGDGDMFFNPESGGIGWSHDRTWVERKLRPLIKAGLVRMEKIRFCSSNAKTWNFYDTRVPLDHLVEAGCFVSNYCMNSVKKHVRLPDGWFKTGHVDQNELISHLTDDNYLYFSYKGQTIPHGGIRINDAIIPLWDYMQVIDDPYPLTESQKSKIEAEVRENIDNKFFTFFPTDFTTLPHNGRNEFHQEKNTIALFAYNLKKKLGYKWLSF